MPAAARGSKLHAMFSATSRKAVVPLLAAAAAAALVSAPAAQAQGAVPVACPATFAVLHDDAIGSLSVPAGPYQLTVQDPSKLTCAQAADAFRQFLEDWDGVLPSPWKLNAATATFTGKPGVAFTIARVATPSGGGGGQHPATGALCPGTFQVLHPDHIGSFSVPKGAYTLTLLSTGTMSCATASSKFASFLSDFDGRLPSPWILDKSTGTFLRGSARVGFRVEPAVGPPAPSGGGGGTVYPAGRRCPGTFRVVHNDRIGALRLPAGRYVMTIGKSGRPSCAQSSRLLARFLQDPTGRLPSPWKVATASGTFSAPGQSFSIKPVAQ
jgi:hypothetical protein